MDFPDHGVAVGGQLGHDVRDARRVGPGFALDLAEGAKPAGVDADIGEIDVDIADVVGVFAVADQAGGQGGLAQVMYHSGYAFLVSANGVFVSHPDNRAIMRESIFSLAEAAGSQELRAVGQAMIRGGEGFARLPDFVLGKPAWLAYTPMPGFLTVVNGLCAATGRRPFTPVPRKGYWMVRESDSAP